MTINIPDLKLYILVGVNLQYCQIYERTKIMNSAYNPFIHNSLPLKLSRPLKMSFKFERNNKRLSLFTKPHRNIP